MKVYSLASPVRRQTVNLREYEAYIRNAVKDTNPNLQVIVDKNSYAIADDATKGEIIRIGRAIAKSPLGKFCVQRPVLFVGADVTFDDEDSDIEVRTTKKAKEGVSMEETEFVGVGKIQKKKLIFPEFAVVLSNNLGNVLFHIILSATVFRNLIYEIDKSIFS